MRRQGPHHHAVLGHPRYGHARRTATLVAIQAQLAGDGSLELTGVEIDLTDTTSDEAD